MSWHPAGTLTSLQKWLPALIGVLLGVLGGLLLYTFVYAQGFSYFSNDPKACANCHVMQEYYDGHAAGPHRHVASCNDCHTPHDLVGKYATKAENGWHHSVAFTSGDYPQNIKAREVSLQIVENNCVRCHGGLTHDARAVVGEGQQISCIRCHGNVGHER